MTSANETIEQSTIGPDEAVARVWAEKVIIPTYGVGKPNKNPMFLEKRVYQGSSGAVYPYAVIDKVEDEKHDKEWQAVFLENRWIKVMILPELGGRVQMALDKTNGYHFVYYNRVIKPALVGLTGPWISGGIEFNWPQHHRPSTYEPVSWLTRENDDGSVSVWCSEIERMMRMRGTHIFTVTPDRAALQVDVRLYNRTELPQSFLWWANPAVHVNENTQSVFPPDVHAVMDHGKRAVSEFPIARGEYYKVNYAPGTDISRYKNIPVPTSYMAYHSDYDFIGNYDHGRRAGMLHVADHHLVPGKKQWTWGTSDFGQSWDRQLTDEDGPYIELMCGAFTDNQPDFSWLMPGEEKRFRQTFLPYKDIGMVCNASEDVAVSMTVEGRVARIGVYAAKPGKYRVELWHDAEELGMWRNHKGMELVRVRQTLFRWEEDAFYEEEIAISPESAWFHDVELGKDIPAHELILRVADIYGYRNPSYEEVVYQPSNPAVKPEIPKAAKAAKDPREIESNEELFLNGQHLEQYRHATYAPEDYYEEALRRDSGDSRCNNAMGKLMLRRAEFEKAEKYFRKSIDRLTLRNTNPYDGEPYYNLGLALKHQWNYDEAWDCFYKATWNDAWKAPAFYELAKLALKRIQFDVALELVNQSLDSSPYHYQAQQLQIRCLYLYDHSQHSYDVAKAYLKSDPFSLGIRHAYASAKTFLECHKIRNSIDIDEGKKIRMVMSAYNEDGVKNLSEAINELAFHENDCIEAAIEIAEQLYNLDLKMFIEIVKDNFNSDNTSLMTGNLDILGTWIKVWERQQSEITEQGVCNIEKWQNLSCARNYIFPNHIECFKALIGIVNLNHADATAYYALGNFYYSVKRYEDAIGCWEKVTELDPGFPTAWRNLGLAYMNKRGDVEAARTALETAFACDESDARVFYELDQLYKWINLEPLERLRRLDERATLCAERDDLTIERIALLNLAGRHGEALELLLGRKFHPWEGGEGKVTGQYVASLLALAREDHAAGRHAEALAKLERARTYPHNLGEGKLYGARENHLDYWEGRVKLAAGDEARMREAFGRAAEGSTEPASAMYYNDQPPEMIFYQGLALKALGREEESRAVLQGLVDWGERHKGGIVKMDYFAVSLPDFLVFDADLQARHEAHCDMMIGLGKLGLEGREAARPYFEAVLARQADHFGAHTHMNFNPSTDASR